MIDVLPHDGSPTGGGRGEIMSYGLSSVIDPAPRSRADPRRRRHPSSSLEV